MAPPAGDTFPAAVATLRTAGAPASALCAACRLLLRLLGGDAVCDAESQRAAADAGVLEAVVATLRGEHAGANDVRFLAAGVLHAVTLCNEEAAAHAVRAGAVEPLLIALLNTNVAVATQCLSTLAELALDGAGAAALVRGGAPARVASVMRAQPSVLELQMAGAVVLKNLVCSKHDGRPLWPLAERARAALAPHFATPLAAALARHPQEDQLQREGFSALCAARARLCGEGGEAHSAYVSAAVAAGLRGAVAAALRGSLTHASGDVTQLVCTAQAWLCTLDATPAQQRTFLECVPPLVALLVRHAAHSGAAEAGLCALNCITADEPVTSAAVVDAGAIGAARAVLAAHPHHVMLTCCALQLLSIAAVHPSGRGAAARNGGVGVAACVGALRTHPRDILVGCAAFTALGNLTNACPPSKVAAHEQGVIPLALAALAMERPREALITEACRTLSNMMSDQDIIRAAAGAAIVPAAAVASLRKYANKWRSAAGQNCALLAHLCIHRDNAEACGAAGMMPLLVATMHAHRACTLVQRFGSMALHTSCDSSKANRVRARAAGDVAAAVAALRAHPAAAQVAYAAVSALSAMADVENIDRCSAAATAAVWSTHGCSARIVADAVVAAMLAHGGDGGDRMRQLMVIGGATAMYNIVLESVPGFADAAVDAGALEALTHAMRRSPASLDVVIAVMRALHVLVSGGGGAERVRVRAAATSIAAAVAAAEEGLAAAGIPLDRRCVVLQDAMTQLSAMFPPYGSGAANAVPAAATSGGGWPPCAGCGAPDEHERGQKPFKLCSACRSARYCSAACQRAHWKAHKADCRKAAAAAAASEQS
jgi:hypothetical protein